MYTEKYLIQKLREAEKTLGRYITTRDLDKLKKYPSTRAYKNCFGTWAKAKKAAGCKSTPKGSANPKWAASFSYESQRRPQNPKVSKLNKRLRFKILERDNFTCQYCGATPQDGAKLAIDHITPFSRGGETIETNLITSCSKCNIGKFDTEYPDIKEGLKFLQ